MRKSPPLAARLVLLAFLAGLAGVAAAPPDALAQDNLEHVRRAKEATALVLVPGGTGSSFCIHPDGYFVTNHHVVRQLRDGGKVSLVLNPATPAERTISASIVRSDERADLALLVADARGGGGGAGGGGAPAAGARGGLAHLSLGESGDLVETQQVVAFGYPFGMRLAVREGQKPSVSVNVVRISSIRRDGNRVEMIQVDSGLNPGNSGGPVIDAKGRVIGIVAAGIPGAGINFLVPVDKLRALLGGPQVSVTPAQVDWSERHKPVEMEVRVTDLTGLPGEQAVEVTLRRGPGTPAEKLKATPTTRPGVYRLTAHPTAQAAAAAAAAAAGPARIDATILFPDGSVKCQVDDVSFSVGGTGLLGTGGTPVKLSELAGLKRLPDGTFEVRTRQGRILRGAIRRPPSLPARLGGEKVALDLAKVSELVIAAPAAAAAVAAAAAEAAPTLAYAVSVLRDGKEIAKAEGRVLFARPARRESGAPARGATIRIDRVDDVEVYRRTIERAAELGCDSVNFVVCAVQDNGSSVEITFEPATTPTPPQLHELVRHARSVGLSVSLTPIVLLREPRDGEWRGVLDPKDWGLWFWSYRRTMLHFAAVARDCEVDLLCVGSELVSSQRFNASWRSLIRAVREVYPGKLTYSANWDNYDKVPFWDELDFVAMNSFWTLGQTPAVGADEVARNWRPIKDEVLAFAKKQGKPLLLMEVGWCSLANAAKDPWDYTREDLPADEALQARLWDGFFRAWHGTAGGAGGLGGFFIYELHPAGPDAKGYTPDGKPAAAVIQQWLGRKWKE